MAEVNNPKSLKRGRSKNSLYVETNSLKHPSRTMLESIKRRMSMLELVQKCDSKLEPQTSFKTQHTTINSILNQKRYRSLSCV